MKFILGKKIAMTQIWVGEDKKAVTAVQAGPAVVLQLKNQDKDGYSAIQIGFGDKKAKNISKSVIGHFKGLGSFRWLKEFRVPAVELANVKVGDTINAQTFAVGDKVTVTGWTKGRGFTGVVKRYDFHGQDATHGNKDQLRMPGSIGAGGVQHVFKGMRMGGRMGNEQTSFHNVNIVKIDEETNIIYLEGSVPGARGSLTLLKADGELKVALPEQVASPEVNEVVDNVEATPEAEVLNENKENETDTAPAEVIAEEPKEELTPNT